MHQEVYIDIVFALIFIPDIVAKSAFVVRQGVFLRGAVEKSYLISLVKYPILV
jgi:hypothetical protein